MGFCEICGKKADSLLRAEIEGTEMDVCQNCSVYGKVRFVSRKNTKEDIVRKRQKQEKEEPELRIVNDYANIVRKIREKLGLTQEEFAKKINEKESLMKSIEGKRTVPSMQVAEKLEKHFNVVLIEEVKDENVAQNNTDSKEFTIGDMIEIKKRKK